MNRFHTALVCALAVLSACASGTPVPTSTPAGPTPTPTPAESSEPLSTEAASACELYTLADAQAQFGAEVELGIDRPVDPIAGEEPQGTASMCSYEIDGVATIAITVVHFFDADAPADHLVTSRAEYRDAGVRDEHLQEIDGLGEGNLFVSTYPLLIVAQGTTSFQIQAINADDRDPFVQAATTILARL